MKKIQNKTIKSKLRKGDILKKMFEHFGIKVIDVNNNSSSNINLCKRQKIKQTIIL